MTNDETTKRPFGVEALRLNVGMGQDKDSLLRVGNVTCEIDTEFKVVYKSENK